MSPIEEGVYPYTDALLYLNGFCGSVVTARVAYERDQVFRISGVLEHVPHDGSWANYQIGDLEIDLVVFQEWDEHYISDKRQLVSFYSSRKSPGMRVDVWLHPGSGEPTSEDEDVDDDGGEG